MDVSIIICTCNRADELSKFLASLGQITVPASLQCETLVIDNGLPMPQSKRPKQPACPICPSLFLQSKQGQSHARNTGIANARGEIIVFTDDDLRFPTDWIARMIEPIQSGQAQAVTGGVHIAPHLERSWMQELHRAWLAETINRNKYIGNSLVGANMAFLRKVLTRVPRFDIELGPGALGFADDSLFSRQLEEAGYTIADQRDVIVEHHFLRSRLTRNSFGDTAGKHGRSSAYMMYHWEHEKVAAPLLQWMRKRLQLALWRRTHPQSVAQTEGMDPAEMHHLRSLALYQQIAMEQKKPRKYERHGLIKKSGSA